MLNINFKDYFWGKCDDLHERYHLKKITISNIIELFSFESSLKQLNFSNILVNIL